MKGTPVTESTFNYIVDLFAGEEKTLLEQMSAKARKENIPMIMISEEQAKFVGFFLKAIKAKRALDIGTLFGYSAAIMGKAIGESGEVVSLEFSAKHAEVAEQNFKDLGLTNIKVYQGAALDHMKTFEDNSFDFIMIDADKANYSNYLEESLRLIRPGGVIAGDNALAWGKVAEKNLPESDEDYSSVTAIQNFNDAFSKEKSIFGVIVPVGDGLAMGVVNK